MMMMMMLMNDDDDADTNNRGTRNTRGKPDDNINNDGDDQVWD